MDRRAAGHFGDAKPVGGGAPGHRLASGPGHRVYYARRDNHIVLLWCGGDNSTQNNDIVRARHLAAAWKPQKGEGG